MGKKKRKIKKSRYLSLEGERERVLYEFLHNLYKPKDNNINIQKPNIDGGDQLHILDKATKECNNGRDMCIAWFDDDFKINGGKKQHENFIKALSNAWNCEIEKDIEYKDLQKKYNKNCDRKPILIVSNPCSIGGLILRIFDKKILEKPTTNKLKMAVDGLFGKLKDAEYYKKYLTKELLEKKRKEIYELDLLLKIFEN